MDLRTDHKQAVHFLSTSSTDILSGRPVIVGCPLDLTSTYRQGSNNAPVAIREASDSIETYSPLLDRDLEDIQFSDLGNIEFQGLTLEDSLEEIVHTVHNVLRRGAIPLCLGGEHLITLPVISAFLDFHPDLFLIHLDAHTDLRDDYDGNPLSHATVIRRIVDLISPERIVQMGIRSGTKEEFQFMRQHSTLMEWVPGMQKALRRKIGERPVYLTVDVDVFDPSLMPATGNPEPGGWFWSDFERFMRFSETIKVVGADVVELNPGLDPSQIGTIASAKIVREILLLLGKNKEN
jgi:agmatinase